ncbi:specifically androgen-regulated gene protein [Syngnathus typhle]|uniref:specifically androgen-regulated gene protein n=1 Tax=Syngnathus typhle TaxID=161592 RepID=UPI002A69A4F9|nr:specifically androgen-regulated gene protein [Syngnathus typhle]
MWTGDMWNDGVALPLSNKDSSGSRDSVISMNSGCSDDSMEHLSPEERACLMYLEQTLEAFELQEDSGLSDDEPDSGQPPDKMALNEINAISRLNGGSGMDRQSETLPTPGVAFPVVKKSVVIKLTEEYKPAQNFVNQTYQPNFSTASEERQASMNVTDSISGCNMRDLHTDELCLRTVGDAPNTMTCITPELALGLIPPPSDFMDDPKSNRKLELNAYLKPDPGTHPMPNPGTDPRSDPGPDPKHHPEADIIKASPHSKSNRPVPIDLRHLYQRALEKRPPASPPVNKKPKDKLLIEARQTPTALESLQPGLSHQEVKEPESPPFVAPKPKRISINSPKERKIEEFNSPIGNGDRELLDHERIHLQALQKLGLLKGSLTDLPADLNHKLSPQTRKSWADFPTPSTPSLPSPSNLTPSHRSESPGATSTASDILPISSGSNDRARLLSACKQSPSEGLIYTQGKAPARSTSDLVKQLTKVRAAQPGAVENSGFRPRYPVNHDERISVERCLNHAASPDLRRRESSVSAFKHSRPSHKVPRSQGISVLICPQETNGVDHHAALKKLGLGTNQTSPPPPRPYRK